MLFDSIDIINYYVSTYFKVRTSGVKTDSPLHEFTTILKSRDLKV